MSDNEKTTDNEDEITMIDRRTGEETKCNIYDLVNLIKIVFPDKEEQKELLRQMFRD